MLSSDSEIIVRNHRLICGLFCLLWAGWVFADDVTNTPARVVSLDYCADQFILEFLSPAQILALSPDADQPFSYLREQVGSLQQVRPVAEDIIAIQPDLIVRSYGGGPQASEFFARAGIPVLQLPFVNDLEGIRQSVLTVAAGLGQSAHGMAVVDEMNTRLEAIKKSKSEVSVLYMTPNGVTSGPGTLVHEMLLAAGLTNFEKREGWHPIPLERLAYEQPDIVASAFFDPQIDHPAKWSAMRHPLALRQMRDLPTVRLQGAWTACGGWFLLDAIEALAAARADI